MDDIYFKDKRNRRKNGDDPYAQRDRFSESDRFDIDENPYLKKRSPYQDEYSDREVFSVTLPDEDEFDVYRDIPLDRTPQGPRKAPPPSRTPSGARVGQGHTDNYIPPQKAHRERPPVSRAPQKPQRNTPNPPRKSRSVLKGGRIAAGIGILFLALFLGIFAYGYSVMGNIDYDDSTTENAYIDGSDLLHSSQVKNILIIGSDEREEGSAEQDLVSGQRADTMILFSIDKKNKQIKLTSFLRDSYVYIPSEGYSDKLNAAYNLGGAQLTMDTLEYNYGIKIDGYVTINFAVFKQFIDLLGGITVDVADYEAEYMIDVCKYPRTKAGLNNFNGTYALMYCRIRYLDNDLYRTQRQRKVIKAVVGKAAKTNLFKLMGIVKQVVPNIRTDISRNELISLGVGAALKFLRYDIVQQQIPANGTWWDETVPGSGDVIAFDLEENCDILEEFVFEKYVEKQSEDE